jgi:hypothetical protein
MSRRVKADTDAVTERRLSGARAAVTINVSARPATGSTTSRVSGCERPAIAISCGANPSRWTRSSIGTPAGASTR